LVVQHFQWLSKILNPFLWLISNCFVLSDTTVWVMKSHLDFVYYA
jgi:hypothetical protein